MRVQDLKGLTYGVVSRAFESLFNAGVSTGHWEDVRKTGLAVICLSFREPKGSPWLNRARDWLFQQKKPQNAIASWNDELWDTCIALIALKRMGLLAHDYENKAVINWILKLYNLNGRHNWYDEPWETSLCLLALLEDARLSEDLLRVVTSGAEWLLSLQDTDGRVVSPTYTAFFLLILHQLSQMAPEHTHFSKAADMAGGYLIEASSPDILWTGEEWTNGLVLWAMSYSRLVGQVHATTLASIVEWFTERQRPNGGWGDVEDTCYVILGLCHLLIQLESKDKHESEQAVFSNLRRHLDTPVLRIQRNFIETHPDGTTSINLSPKLKRLSSLAVAFVSVVVLLFSFWDVITRIFLRILE